MRQIIPRVIATPLVRLVITRGRYLYLIFLFKNHNSSHNNCRCSNHNHDPPGEIALFVTADIGRLCGLCFQLGRDLIAADGADFRSFCCCSAAGDVGILILDVAAAGALVVVIVLIGDPLVAVCMLSFSCEAADGAIGIAGVFEVVVGIFALFFTAVADVPVAVFVGGPFLGIFVDMLQSGLDHILTLGADLGALLGGLGAGGMGGDILLVLTDGAFVEVVVPVLAPGFFVAVLAGLFQLADGTIALVGSIVGLCPLAPGVGGQLFDLLNLGGLTAGTGEGLFALFGAGSLLGHDAPIPGVSLRHFLVADRAGVLVVHFVYGGEVAEGVLAGGGNGLFLGGLTAGAGEGLHALVAAGGLLGHSTAIPGVGFGDFLVTGGAGVLVVVFIHRGEVTEGVLAGGGNGFFLGGITDGAGVGLHALIAAGGLLGDSASVPLVVLGVHSAALGAGLAVAGFSFGPCAVVVVAGDGNGHRAGGDALAGGNTDGSGGGDGVAAHSSAVLDLHIEGEDGAGDHLRIAGEHKGTGLVFGNDLVQGYAGNIADAAGHFKDGGIIAEYNSTQGDGFGIAQSCGDGKGVAGVEGGFGCSQGYAAAGGKYGHSQHCQSHQQAENTDEFFHNFLSLC